MKILDSILEAIRFGVGLLRAHAHPHVEVDVDISIEIGRRPLTREEVNAMLAAAAKCVPGASNWRTSIVDLLKVLRLDSSLQARQALGYELGYDNSRGPIGSAGANTWMHDEVMTLLADGGSLDTL